MHRLRTVTYLDVSAVAGHHAMPAALLFQTGFAFCVYLGKCDFSFAIEYCLISHKSQDREIKRVRKIYLKF